MSFADLLTYHLCAHYVLGVQAGKSRTVLGQLTSTFYATIPHAFGMRAGPIITDLSTVEEKYNMINTLRDIDTAQQMLRDDSDAAPAEHPLDAKYRQLKTDLTFVGQDDDDHEVCAVQLCTTSGCSCFVALAVACILRFCLTPCVALRRRAQIIRKYIQATSKDPSRGYLAAGGRDKLRNIWRVDRHGEHKRFKTHDSLGNRHLLWHGTNIAAVAAIFKNGLRIMPHSGGRVGRGIYLADSQVGTRMRMNARSHTPDARFHHLLSCICSRVFHRPKVRTTVRRPTSRTCAGPSCFLWRHRSARSIS